jgi:membrane protease YdiL (CAAX protease family)
VVTAYPDAFTTRPPQGRGSGGRVTPSAKATEAAAAEATEAAKAASKAGSKGRVLRSTKARPAASPPAGSSATGAGAGSGKGSSSGANKGANKGASKGAAKGSASGTTKGATTASKATDVAEPADVTPTNALVARVTGWFAGTASTEADEDKAPQAATAAPDAADDAPVWGMGDVLIWWLVSFVAVAVVYAIVSSYLVSNGTYVGYWPNEEGWAIGEVAGRIGLGQEPMVTVGVNGAPLWLQTLLQLPLWAVLVAGPVFVAKRKRLSLRDDFGLSFRLLDAPIGLVIGIACQLVLIPVIYWVLFKLVGEQDVSAAARSLTDRADDVWGVIALFLIVGVGAPIAEELFYRGLSQHAIAKRFGARLAVLMGAAFFGFSHLQPLQFLGLFGFGLVLGFLTERFDRIGPAIFAHMGFNMTAAVVLVWNLPVA